MTEIDKLNFGIRMYEGIHREDVGGLVTNKKTFEQLAITMQYHWNTDIPKGGVVGRYNGIPIIIDDRIKNILLLSSEEMHNYFRLRGFANDST